MSQFNDLRKAINAFLETKHPRVYFQQADTKAAFPYLVFDLPNMFDSGDSPVIYVLDVDGWDDDANTAVLEELMETVDGDGNESNPTGLRRRVLAVGENSRAAVYRDAMLAPPPPTDEPKLRRRRFSYQVRVYER
jgi:hypothetical protein